MGGAKLAELGTGICSGWWWRSHLNSGNGDNDDASAQGIMQII